MKTRWMVLLVASALGGGCVPNNFVTPASPSATAEKAVAKPTEAPTRSAYQPPVTAGQINGTNAREKAQALRDEIDADMIATIEARSKKE
jgi:hypothetical protein